MSLKRIVQRLGIVNNLNCYVGCLLAFVYFAVERTSLKPSHTYRRS